MPARLFGAGLFGFVPRLSHLSALGRGGGAACRDDAGPLSAAHAPAALPHDHQSYRERGAQNAETARWRQAANRRPFRTKNRPELPPLTRRRSIDPLLLSARPEVVSVAAESPTSRRGFDPLLLSHVCTCSEPLELRRDGKPVFWTRRSAAPRRVRLRPGVHRFAARSQRGFIPGSRPASCSLLLTDCAAPSPRLRAPIGSAPPLFLLATLPTHSGAERLSRDTPGACQPSPYRAGDPLVSAATSRYRGAGLLRTPA